MSTPARLAAFALILAAAFVAAAAIGRAVGPLERGTADEPAHAGEAEAEEPHAGSFSVVVAPGASLVFRVLGERGEPVQDYDVLHERPMHLIVVRRDLTGFMHLHPRLRDDGTWSVPLELPAPGTWTAFADFSTGGERATVPFDLHAPGDFEPTPLPEPSSTAQAGPYEVRLAGHPGHGELAFEVTRAGRPVEVDRYLGAGGHLVILREGDLAYLHAHADEDELAFETDFPSEGRYRLFLQFSAGGAVHTAEFTVRT